MESSIADVLGKQLARALLPYLINRETSPDPLAVRRPESTSLPSQGREDVGGHPIKVIKPTSACVLKCPFLRELGEFRGPTSR